MKRSLTEPGHLVTLNPEEMERLVARVPLNAQEQHQLQAAPNATAAQMQLAPLMRPDLAFQQAERIFRLLLTGAEHVGQLPQLPRWNIFACELHHILTCHRWTWRSLLTIRVVRHHETIRRLRQGLRSPSQLSMLTLEELERLCLLLPLNEQEWNQLSAAMIATAILRFWLQAASTTAWSQAEEAYMILRQADYRLPTKRPLLPTNTQVITQWLAACHHQGLAPATLTTYQQQLTHFTAFLQHRGLGLFSAHRVIAHRAVAWATTPRASSALSIPLRETTVQQRLAALSTFYAFVSEHQIDERFTTNPIPVHQALLTSQQSIQARAADPLILSPEAATQLLAHLDRTGPQTCRDYALLWIALVSGATPHTLLALRVEHLRQEGDRFRLYWPFSAPPLLLPAFVSQALVCYLANYHASDVFHA